MKITQPAHFIESYLQHRLDAAITVEQINAALPGIEGHEASDDGKAEHHWAFLADEQECAIWDYGRARWSAFGPIEVFNQLGLRIVSSVGEPA